MLSRVKVRLGIEDNSQDLVLGELLQGAQDTVCLYIDESELPDPLQTTVVMMAVEAYNRLGTEGVKSENKGSLSQSFYDDSLDPYRSVLDKYVEKQRAKKRVLWV